MMARFLKLVSNNPLAATIVGTIIGGWILAWTLTLKVSDMGGVLGPAAAWLRTLESVARLTLVTLAALAFLFGFLLAAAIFAKHYRNRTPPIDPILLVSANDLTTWQQIALMELVNNWPETRDLIGIFSAIKKENAGRTWPVHKGEVARDMEALERLGWVRIEPVGAEHVAYYQLTTAGRDRLLADRERALKRGKN